MNIMIDLETLGTQHNAVILSIGAAMFDEAGISGDTFYVELDAEAQQKMGRTIDASTVKWWAAQRDEARMLLTREGLAPQRGLIMLDEWLSDIPFKEREVWGNGATFDNVLLTSLIKDAGFNSMWPFWGDRCYRTLKNQHPNVPLVRKGTHHNALDDAISQAEHAAAILRSVK